MQQGCVELENIYFFTIKNREQFFKWARHVKESRFAFLTHDIHRSICSRNHEIFILVLPRVPPFAAWPCLFFAYTLFKPVFASTRKFRRNVDVHQVTQPFLVIVFRKLGTMTKALPKSLSNNLLQDEDIRTTLYREIGSAGTVATVHRNKVWS